MTNSRDKNVSPLMVIIAFAIVYVVWGSTYFFIQKAVHSFPPFMLGALRFSAAGLIMLFWCLTRGEQVFRWKTIKHAIITGFLLLFIGTGAVIWVEQFISSALVAILVSSSPLWFVLLDKPQWKQNLSNRSTLIGLLLGFAGVVVLFYENIAGALEQTSSLADLGGLSLLMIGAICWSGGSLYSKYKSSGTATVNSTWQMLSAAAAFLLCSFIRQEYATFSVGSVTTEAWLSVAYLVVFGSIAAFSAYVWLLEVRPATQVSTYAYVNPVVAVLLGVFFANETVTFLQISGLVIILLSVLLINLAKYRKSRSNTIAAG